MTLFVFCFLFLLETDSEIDSFCLKFLLDTTYFTKNLNHFSEIIFKCVNSAIRPFFS